MSRKIPLIYLAILLGIVILIIFCGYQYFSRIPKKIKIDESLISEEILQTDYSIQDINKNEKTITCAIQTKYFPEEKYTNYVIGEGQGKKVNCNILLKIDGTYYKLKTLVQGSPEEEIVNLLAIGKNKYLEKDYQILIYDNENQKIYQYSRR